MALIDPEGLKLRRVPAEAARAIELLRRSTIGAALMKAIDDVEAPVDLDLADYMPATQPKLDDQGPNQRGITGFYNAQGRPLFRFDPEDTSLFGCDDGLPIHGALVTIYMRLHSLGVEGSGISAFRIPRQVWLAAELGHEFQHVVEPDTGGATPGHQTVRERTVALLRELLPLSGARLH